MNREDILQIVKASGVTTGERVLIHFWGEDADKATANMFLSAAASLGATPILLQQSRTVNYEIFKTAKDSCFDDAYFSAFSGFDAVLDVFAYQPIVLGYTLDPNQMALYRRYISKLFYALMKAKRFTQIRIPTEANAKESQLDAQEYIKRMESAYHIDYGALKTSCEGFREKLVKSKRYILRTGNGCELKFDLTGRQWHVDAGDGDWPCGEIYIAPRETETEGSLFYPTLYLEDAGRFENVTLYVSEGKLNASDNEPVSEYLKKLEPEKRVVCELGFGMNPHVKDLCGYTVLDEKMANSFHIAIGANTMFGGENEAGAHVDFVNDGEYELMSVP